MLQVSTCSTMEKKQPAPQQFRLAWGQKVEDKSPHGLAVERRQSSAAGTVRRENESKSRRKEQGEQTHARQQQHRHQLQPCPSRYSLHRGPKAPVDYEQRVAERTQAHGRRVVVTTILRMLRARNRPMLTRENTRKSK